MLPEDLDASVKDNDAAIAQAMGYADRSDMRLAEALFTCWKGRYFSKMGYHSIEEYVMKRWEGTPQAFIASMKASTIYRLIREYKVALEVPLFREEFDTIPRSNRQLIAQILTYANARTWIDLAKTLKYKVLKARINGLPITDKPNALCRLVFTVTAAQKAVIDEALQQAGRLMELNDPLRKMMGARLEMLAAEFVATYGAAVV